MKSICKLIRIGKWYEPRLVFICLLVEVIREADVNETSAEDGLALPGSLIGESQLRIPKLEPDIMFSNRVSLVSVELEYHTDWCASASSSDGPGKDGNLLRKSLLGYVDVGNDQLRVSQCGRDGLLLQMSSIRVSGDSGFRDKFIDL